TQPRKTRPQSTISSAPSSVTVLPALTATTPPARRFASSPTSPPNLACASPAPYRTTSAGSKCQIPTSSSASHQTSSSASASVCPQLRTASLSPTSPSLSPPTRPCSRP